MRGTNISVIKDYENFLKHQLTKHVYEGYIL